MSKRKIKKLTAAGKALSFKQLTKQGQLYDLLSHGRITLDEIPVELRRNVVTPVELEVVEETVPSWATNVAPHEHSDDCTHGH